MKTNKPPKTRGRARPGPAAAGDGDGSGPAKKPARLCSITEMERGPAPSAEDDRAHAGSGEHMRFGSSAEVDDECSQAAVTYDDPEQEERQRLIAQLQGAQSPVARPESPTTPRQGTRSKRRRAEPSTAPRVLLSALDAEQKRRLQDIIRRLGGQTIEQNTFDRSCTHLVVGKANRTEKYLAALASGKWVLAAEFIEASGRAGRFVPEEEFEFGNPDGVAPSPSRL